jgi:hypothetical protein
MKRLINAYRIELSRLLAEGRRAGSAAVTPEQLALWTIVSLRWPLLADELVQRPGVLIGDSAQMRTELRRLWASAEVQAVIRGDGVFARLTHHAVSTLAGLSLPGSGQSPEQAGGQGSVA